MPYRQSEYNSGRFAWARLNADTLFLGLLVALSGAFALAAPGDAVTEAGRAGDVFPLFYVLSTSYLVSGLLIILALVRAAVRVETVGRAVLIGGTALNVYRHLSWLGLSDSETIGQIVVFILVVSTTALRMSVLLGRSGVLITRHPVPDDEKEPLQ